MELPKKPNLLTAVLATAALAFTPFAQAEEISVATVPVGYVSKTIQASPNGSAYSITFLEPSLLVASQVNGASSGVISGLGQSTLTVDNAGWTSGELVSGAPNYAMIISGLAEGLILRVTANTDTTLTLDTEGLDLSSLGIESGQDRITLIQGDTLLGFLGTTANGVIGGSAADFAANLTDRVLMKDAVGIVRTYYYNTAVSPPQWRRGGSSANQDATPIAPTAGLVYYRIGMTDIELNSVGQIPTNDLIKIVPAAGVSLFARYFPTTTTLAELNFDALPGWRSTSQEGVSIANADKIVTKDAVGIIRQFYFDGTNWRRGGSATPQNDVVIEPGSSIYTNRFGLSNQYDLLKVLVPYDLN